MVAIWRELARNRTSSNRSDLRSCRCVVAVIKMRDSAVCAFRVGILGCLGVFMCVMIIIYIKLRINYKNLMFLTFWVIRRF